MIFAPSVEVNEVVSLNVVAVLLSGAGAPAYSWTAVCRDELGDPSGNAGTFTRPTEASTDWSRTLGGECDITVTAEDPTNLLTASVTLEPITITPSNSSDADVTTVLIPHRFVEQVELTAAGFSCTVDRDDANGTCNPGAAGAASQAIGGGSAVDVVVTTSAEIDAAIAAGQSVTISLEATDAVLGEPCGAVADEGGQNPRAFTWTAPVVDTACVLTTTIAFGALQDVLEVGVLVGVAGMCAADDDDFEDNDINCAATDGVCDAVDLGSLVSGQSVTSNTLVALDDDWFLLNIGTPGTSQVVFGASTTGDAANFGSFVIYRQPLPDSSLFVLGSAVMGQDSGALTVEDGEQLYLHLSPAAGVDVCSADMTYTISIDVL